MTEPTSSHRLRVGLFGSRGIPAGYGGYETLMEELAPRLVAAGFDVTVFCRSHNTPKTMTEYRGVHLVTLPTVRSKHLDTPVHTLLSALRSWREGFDAALVVNSANAVFVPLVRLRTPTALHVDGIEKRRAKWGPLGRWVYAVSERLAGRVANVLITDADVIRRHYLERYNIDSTMITYGTRLDAPAGRSALDRLGLEPGRYVLYVSRFERENNPHRVAEAYRLVGGDLPLVMVGAAPYADRFIASFTRDADPRVLFPGAIYGEGYRELQHHALAYVHATEVGGTHPALVEAMGQGTAVVVHDTAENREVAGPRAAYFDAALPETLSAQLERLIADPELTARLGDAAKRRAAERFSWDAVTNAYVRVFRALARVC